MLRFGEHEDYLCPSVRHDYRAVSSLFDDICRPRGKKSRFRKVRNWCSAEVLTLLDEVIMNMGPLRRICMGEY